jgi:hypothetical protein
LIYVGDIAARYLVNLASIEQTTVFSSVTHSIQTGGIPLQNTPSYEGLDALYQVLRSVVMQPEFQSAVAEIQTLPPSERQQAAFTQLTPEVLTARGIQIPKECTITVHVLQDLAVLNDGNADSVARGKPTLFCFRLFPTNIEICFVNNPSSF